MLVDSRAKELVDKSILEWIYEQDHTERLETYRINQNYYDGETKIRFPDPAIEQKLKEHGYRANICKAVVDASVGFLSKHPLAFEVEVDEGKEEAGKEIEKFIYNAFRDNRLMTGGFLKALRIQGKKGEFALKIWPEVEEEGGEVKGYKITVLRPDICFPKWNDENYEELECFPIVYPRNNPDTGRREMFAQVWWDDIVKEYVKPIGAKAPDVWRLVREWKNEYGFIPIVWVANKEDDGPWSEADITSDLKDIQDFINKTVTDLAYTQDSESFRTGFILGASPPLDPNTKQPIEIKHQPGNLHWVLGDGERIPQLGEFSGSDFKGFLDVLDKALELVSVITRVPRNELSIGDTAGGGTPPSGRALEVLYQSFISKTDEKKALLGEGLEVVAWRLVQMAWKDGYNFGEKAREEIDFSVTCHIQTGLPRDEEQDAKTLAIHGENLWKSKETIMNELGIEDVEKEKKKILDELREYDVYGAGEFGRLDEELKAMGIDQPSPEL